MNILNCTTITKQNRYKAKKFGVALSGLNNQMKINNKAKLES
jgi:hypothetical protein